MDLLDRLLDHDAWTTRQFLLLALPLSDAQLDRPFDIGFKTLRATFDHLIYNMEVWTDLLRDQPQRPRGRTSVPELLQRLDAIAPELAAFARHIQATSAWNATYIDTLDVPPVTRSYGTTIAHILTHSMHHRAQLLYMFRLLGLTNLPEGDPFSWEKRPS